MEGRGCGSRVPGSGVRGSGLVARGGAHALLARRYGLEVVREFRDLFEPLLTVVWVDVPLHRRGIDRVLDRGQRHLSLVDVVSFLVMRDQRIDEAFAIDRHFEKAGFQLV